MKYTEHEYFFEVFDWDVKVVLTDNVPAYCKENKLCDYENVFAYCDTQANESLTRLIFPYSPDPDDVAHEASHATEEMFEALGVVFKGEMAAYHIGYFTRIVLDAENNRKKKKLKK